MRPSLLDKCYRKTVVLKMFTDGWGKTSDLVRLVELRRRIINKKTGFAMVESNHPIKIIKNQEDRDGRILEGHFENPLVQHCPEIVPTPVQTAYFQMVLPLQWKSDGFKPVCIHLAGTGDHYFWRRRIFMAKYLLKHGIGSILLENPYYGLRKPKNQLRSSLRKVSDVFVMGGSLILECAALLNYCEKAGFGPLGITGMSLGGHMASLAATFWPKQLVLVPCLSWSTASVVFTEGILSESVDWDSLRRDYMAKKEDLLNIPLLTLQKDPPKLDDKKKDLPNIPLIAPPSETNVKGTLNKSETVETENSPSSLSLVNVKPTTLLGLNDLNNTEKVLMNKTSKKTVLTVRKNLRHKECVSFMNKIMDEFTHLKNYPKPYDPSLITIFCAECDAYVPREQNLGLQDIWPGSAVIYLRCGHVSAYVWYRKTMLKTIVKAFEAAKIKYPDVAEKAQKALKKSDKDERLL